MRGYFNSLLSDSKLNRGRQKEQRIEGNRFLLSLQFALAELPRWLLLAIVVYAPWAFGCTRWWAKTLLIQSLLAISLLWLVSLLLRRRWPRMATPAGVAALSLLGLGWLSVFNALATYDELAQLFSPVSQPVSGWLGSWDAAFSMNAMRLVTALMGAFFISMDFAANPLWRRRLFFTLSLNGGLLLLFGLAQRATSAEGIFWGPASNGPFFATYLNHSNAGAFINLTLPILAGQTFLAFQNRGSQIGRAFWSFLLLANVAAVFVNTSRASMVIGILIMMVLALGGARTFIRREGNLRPRVVAVVAVVLACALILILSVGIERSLARWNQTMNALFISQDGSFFDGRFRIYRVCWLSLPAAGWFGFGPGTFSIVFPFLQREHGVELNGILRYAHQDYLQAILEWGAVGFLLWAVLIGGGNRPRGFVSLQRLAGYPARACDETSPLRAVAGRSADSQPDRFPASDCFAAIDNRRPFGSALGKASAAPSPSAATSWDPSNAGRSRSARVTYARRQFRGP